MSVSTISDELLDKLLDELSKGCDRPDNLPGEGDPMKDSKIRLVKWVLGADLLMVRPDHEAEKLRKDDILLVRNVADALTDPAREKETRTFLREHFSGGKTSGFKALLEAAPLEGVDIGRESDFGGEVSP